MQEKWDQNTFIFDNMFSSQVALDIIRDNEFLKSQIVNDCRLRQARPKWKDAI